MTKKVVPMIHVPDVRATVDWYEGIGFKLIETYGNESDGLSFAILSFGSSEVMFNQGGRQSAEHRREVDLYAYIDNVDDRYRSLKDRVEVEAKPHDTFYGMREFTVRDLNRFWITFGEPSVFGMLMTGIQEEKTDLVRTALERGGLSPERLTAALAIASSDDQKNHEIIEVLKKAGAVPPPEVDKQRLESHVGKYKSEQGFEINVALRDGRLLATPGNQQPLSLMAVDETTFAPIFFDDYGTLTFIVDAGKTIGCVLKHGENAMQLRRVEDEAP